MAALEKTTSAEVHMPMGMTTPNSNPIEMLSTLGAHEVDAHIRVMMYLRIM